MMRDDDAGFGGWLEASMRSRGMTQAQLARSVGVADTQVSRWRRGQVVPSLQYLQRLADAFGVERVALDELLGLPIAQVRSERDSLPDPQLEAELQAHQARLRQVMQSTLPPSMWRAYVEACVALAEGLSSSASRALRASLDDVRPAEGHTASQSESPPNADPTSHVEGSSGDEAPVDQSHHRPLGFRT
jgi:transcriptional regulator with XRE-family HTH domain